MIQLEPLQEWRYRGLVIAKGNSSYHRHLVRSLSSVWKRMSGIFHALVVTEQPHMTATGRSNHDRIYYEPILF
jgi:hypothetical protein